MGDCLLHTTGSEAGAGKSTLGQNPDCSNCTFTVCNGHVTCIKNTVGSWLAEGPDFTIVDTPR